MNLQHKGRLWLMVTDKGWRTIHFACAVLFPSPPHQSLLSFKAQELVHSSPHTIHLIKIQNSNNHCSCFQRVQILLSPVSVHRNVMYLIIIQSGHCWRANEKEWNASSCTLCCRGRLTTVQTGAHHAWKMHLIKETGSQKKKTITINRAPRDSFPNKPC